MIPDDAAAWLRAWDSQGFHRTGTEGDEAGATWLVGEAVALGATVAGEPFALDRIDPDQCCLELDGSRIGAAPVFDAPPTGPDGISGTLGPGGSDATIGVAELSPHAVYSGEYQALRRDAPHRALVIVCQGTHPGMGLLNAERFRAPYGAPAIQVSSEARDTVRAALARGAVARVTAQYRCTAAIARNVVVTLPGRDRARPPLVVMTPRSSWWQSTAERGGGLVCWLESLRALLATPPAMDVVLTANSGHELGHLGLDAFIAQRPGWGRDALWVHFGANLGAAGGRLTVMSASDDLRALAARELTHAGELPDVLAPGTQVPSGETRDIHRAGGRYVTLVGSNPWFHLPQDRWPHAVDVTAVERIASAAARMVVALTR
ncbi:MAG TPA: hypothetical protein VKI44_25905 [Acetobacteraceae bacterium]|nr:hypothetical protein [Acetobacteraceae bacterium]